MLEAQIYIEKHFKVLKNRKSWWGGRCHLPSKGFLPPHKTSILNLGPQNRFKFLNYIIC